MFSTQKIEHKRSQWITMTERIIGLVEIVNVCNVQTVADQMLNDDLNFGRGLFCQAILKSQSEFPESSDVYASLVAIINAELPDVGQLLVKRVILQFKEAYDCRDKENLQKASKFLAQLVNQRVVFEFLALDVLMYLLLKPSSDNVEIAVSFCTQCGSLLMEIAPYKLKEVLGEYLRILRKGLLEKRVQVMLVKLFAAKRSNFQKYPRIIAELDLVKVEDQVTHDLNLLQDIDPETSADSFDPDSTGL